MRHVKIILHLNNIFEVASRHLNNKAVEQVKTKYFKSHRVESVALKIYYSIQEYNKIPKIYYGIIYKSIIHNKGLSSSI
jgi:hypothetical protein